MTHPAAWRLVGPALIALACAVGLPGCVEVPDRSSAMSRPDGGALSDGPLDMPDSADLDPGFGDIDGAPDATPVDSDPIDPAPDMLCPAPCPDPEQLAAYVPLDRVDALEVLGDGTVLIAGQIADLDGLIARWRARDIAPSVAALPRPRPENAIGVDDTAVVLHLAPDLSRVEGVYPLPGGITGPIIDMRRGARGARGLPLILVTAHGNGRVADGAVAPDRGYLVSTLAELPDALPDGEMPSRLVPAAGRYQREPPIALGPDGALVTIDGAPDAPVISEARWYGADGQQRALPGWRHHVGPDGLPFFGAVPLAHPGPILHSTLPLTIGDRCALRSASQDGGPQQVYLEAEDDGNGGLRVGHRPADGFAMALCPRPDPSAVPAGSPPEMPPPMGSHGWALAPGVASAVSGLAIAATGALFIGLDAEATRDGHPADRVPAVVAYDNDGHLRWWRRLHPEGVDDDPVVPVASPTRQRILGVALDESVPPGGGDGPGVVIMAQSKLTDPFPLWSAVAGGGEGFQGLPASRGTVEVGWIGRLDQATGALQAVTWIYRVNRPPTPERMRAGRLRCFIDESLSDGAPQATFLAPGRLAVGPDGQVAVAGIGIGLANTPDAIQPTSAPEGSPAEPTGAPTAPFVRIYDRALATVLYATAIAPRIDDADPRAVGSDLDITDLAFTADGALIVVGQQSVRRGDDGADASGALATRNVPGWADAAWLPAERDTHETRGFVMRLVPDPTCGAPAAAP